MNKYDSFSEDYFINFADQAIAKLEDGLDAAGDYAYVMVQAEKGSALGYAKFLHHVNLWWEKIEHDPEENFTEWAVRKVAKNRDTVHKRICEWEFLTEYVPPEHREAFFRNWNIGMLDVGYRVAVKHRTNKKVGNYNLVKSGYEVEPADWLALSECIDIPMVLEIKGKIDGKEPNKNRVSFGYKNGELWFYRGKREQVVIGSLFDGSESELVQDGIAEALEKLGVK